MHVLIADDDPTLRLLLQAAFTKDGWKVTLASDAMQAVAAAQRQPPDLILLDLRMPAGSGDKALERIRMLARTRGIPVVIVSGAVDEFRMRERAEDLKVWAVVEKPVDPDAPRDRGAHRLRLLAATVTHLWPWTGQNRHPSQPFGE